MSQHAKPDYPQFVRHDHNRIALAIARQDTHHPDHIPRDDPRPAPSSEDAARLHQAQTNYAAAILRCKNHTITGHLEQAEAAAWEADELEEFIEMLTAQLREDRTRADGNIYRVEIDGTPKFFTVPWNELNQTAPGRQLVKWVREEGDRIAREDREERGECVWRTVNGTLQLREYIRLKYPKLPQALEQLRLGLRLEP